MLLTKGLDSRNPSLLTSGLTSAPAVVPQIPSGGGAVLNATLRVEQIQARLRVEQIEATLSRVN